MSTQEWDQQTRTSLFGALSRSEILAEYFNKKPLLVTHAIANPEGLLNLDQFYAALPDTENVRAIFNTMHRASIAPNDARDMFFAGATICVTGIDLAVPAIRDLIKRVKSELGYLGILSSNAYLSPPGSGLSKHYDPRIVTVVQLLGKKQWEYSLQPFEKNPLKVSYDDNSREFLLERHNSEVGICSVSLSPGDVLCLPAGTVHQARAESESLSLNLAFDYIGNGMADLLTSWVCEELLIDPEFREPCFSYGSPNQEVAIQKVIDRLETVLRELRLRPLDCLPPN